MSVCVIGRSNKETETETQILKAAKASLIINYSTDTESQCILAVLAQRFATDEHTHTHTHTHTSYAKETYNDVHTHTHTHIHTHTHTHTPCVAA